MRALLLLLLPAVTTGASFNMILYSSSTTCSPSRSNAILHEGRVSSRCSRFMAGAYVTGDDCLTPQWKPAEGVLRRYFRATEPKPAMPSTKATCMGYTRCTC